MSELIPSWPNREWLCSKCLTLWNAHHYGTHDNQTVYGALYPPCECGGASMPMDSTGAFYFTEDYEKKNGAGSFNAAMKDKRTIKK